MNAKYLRYIKILLFLLLFIGVSASIFFTSEPVRAAAYTEEEKQAQEELNKDRKSVV